MRYTKAAMPLPWGFQYSHGAKHEPTYCVRRVHPPKTALHEGERMKPPTVDEFAQKCLRYNKAHGTDISKLEVCPVHHYASTINKACFSAVPTIKECPVCHKPMCPDCGNHNVTQLSRVTGYMSSVEGWNAAKRQELEDRKRYNLTR